MDSRAITQPGRPDGPAPFWQKVTLSLVDKLVLGLLIVLAGFALNMVLEHYRTEAALQNEFAQARVEKVAQVWNVLQEQEHNLEALAGVEEPASIDDLWTDEAQADFREARQQFDADKEAFRQILRQNEFWLEADLTKALRKYADTQTRISAKLARLPGFLQRLQAAAESNLNVDRALDAFEAYAKGIEKAAKELESIRTSVKSDLADLVR
jgi:hypothetical protein